MTTITPHAKQCTLINVFTVSPERQQELIDTLVAATEQVIRALPGFISANIHKSVDGVRVTNYAQWENATALQAMLGNPEANAHIEKCRALAEHVDFHLYTVEHCSVATNVAG
ncbi:MAG TPA: antibiotic biosynthesis monooxygenase [Ktedonobacter sp.]|jgi:quinol monooxygenase YgiN|nr:antibiotic biosynthesis monooxygenase [Ktedonobacter sp.]HAT47246.1 antibiotic biosynthesis monooxygenase [Ktedonobacter sp.]HBE26715.1 antibiotic biosynthesis monooxygenase [Ktedonobacter sp.]HBE27956.1 antibiotic biosynthesis monooxygenase [Ktedonobacter sp.]HCF86022.1 antibiotic biosynthesis monooxygenase [Ktedonobacter sp.]